MAARLTERKKRRPARFKAGASDNAKSNSLLIAAIGASAGGIEALSDLVSHLAPNTGMAFVLIQHLDPKHHSMLAELLSKKTSMNVREVTDGMRVEFDNVYVIPPDATMSISNHTLKLTPREQSHSVHMSIDHFMRSLAEAEGNRAIGVILSGTGTDGTLGMAEIQAQGGVTFAQDENSAKYDSMPRSAIAADSVDYVLPPKGIAKELARIAHHPYVARSSFAEAEQSLKLENPGLNTIFRLLRRSSGVDFTHYRQTTILRRIQRRMVVHKIAGLNDYLKYVRSDPAEIKALYQDILINVTSFFRGPKMFDALKSEVFSHILKNRPEGSTIRCWTPGCASGEETYSLAMALLEFLGEKATETPMQFFGTDVSDPSITRARMGMYPENIQGDVSPERLRRFFTKVDNGYRISKSIRDICIFAQHNVLSDPPFSQMDVICCRNLLIYLEPILQTKVISLFHYASRPGGYLVLGNSEGIGPTANLFTPVNRSQKIFLRKSTAARQSVSFSLTHAAERAELGAIRVPAKPPDNTWNYLEAQKEFDRRLLSQYAPATVFINEDLEIIHTRGAIDRYLKISPGRASLSVLKMAREGLLMDLHNAISRAKKDNVAVRKQNVEIKDSDSLRAARSVHSIRFEVVPITVGNLNEMYFMVIFQDEPSELRRGRSARRAAPLPNVSPKLPPSKSSSLNRNLAPPRNICSPSSKPRKPLTRSCKAPTKKFSPAMKSCKALTRNWKPPRKNFSPPTKNSPPSTTSSATATSKSLKPTTTSPISSPASTSPSS